MQLISSRGLTCDAKTNRRRNASERGPATRRYAEKRARVHTIERSRMKDVEGLVEMRVQGLPAWEVHVRQCIVPVPGVPCGARYRVRGVSGGDPTAG